MRRIRVLVCEFSTIHHKKLRSGFSEAFRYAGFEADIRISSDISEAVDQITRFSYEVLVTDLSFNEHLTVGLSFIQKIKRDFPELFVIACSSSAPSYDDTRTMQPTFNLFVPKRIVLTPAANDLEDLGKSLRSSLNQLCGFSIDVEGAVPSSLSVSGQIIPERDIHSLVAQIYGDLSATASKFQPVRVKLRPITGGYSGSLVVIAELQGEDPELKYVKTVIKFSLLDWATDEAINFKRYAKWMLPFNKRVELVGEGQTKKFGAVAYAFVFGGESEIFNLTEIIENGDIAGLDGYLQVIFDDELINFYNSTSLKSDVAAGQHYRSRYFPDSRIVDNEQKFEATVLRDFKAVKSANGYLIKGEHFPDPFRVIFSGIQESFGLSVCHGDFNSNNIICADADRVAYIDFQDTGPGHILQDFAALEHSIRLNWCNNHDHNKRKRTEELIRAEKQVLGLLSLRGNKDAYHKRCAALRSLAQERFPSLECWEYPFAAGALALKLMRLSNLSETQRKRLAACALVSTQRVEELARN